MTQDTAADGSSEPEQAEGDRAPGGALAPSAGGAPERGDGPAHGEASRLD